MDDDLDDVEVLGSSILENCDSDPRFVPRGQHEDLDEAVDALGPFMFGTKLEAACAHAEGRLRDVSIAHMRVQCREDAIEQVTSLAAYYNATRAMSDDSLRISDICRQLQHLSEAAFAFAGVLYQLEPECCDLLQTIGHPVGISLQGSDPYFRACYELAAVADLPLAERRPLLQPGPHTWIERAAALSEWAKTCRDHVIRYFGSGDPNQPDRGGRKNLFMCFGGPPPWRLARAAYVLFDDCHPGVASSTVEGKFHRFVAAIYRYASGRDDDGVVEKAARRVARLEKLSAPLLDRLVRLDEAIARIAVEAEPPSATNPPDSPSALKWRFEREKDQVDVEFEKIHRELNPNLAAWCTEEVIPDANK